MVIDSSAIIAILQLEPEAKFFAQQINLDSVRLISAANLVEASIVLDARRSPPSAANPLDQFIERAGISVEPVTTEQAMIARQAYRRFGRGHHPAKLNFGDCFAYALAMAAGEPLLFKSTDFGLTDIRPVA